MSRTSAALVALTLLSGVPLSAQAPATACHAAVPSHIRVMNCGLALALADGLERSATLREVVGRIGSLNGVVYVVFEPISSTNKKLLGFLSHRIAVTGSTSILYVSVRRNSGDAAVATVAHEFRHAVELLEDPSARTEAQIDALFERIGTRTSAGVFETDAATGVERSVQHELRATKHALAAGRP
jgi:hypothetical protein